jgi:hypothetical protein
MRYAIKDSAKGAGLVETWGGVVDLASKQLSPKVAKQARALPLLESLVGVTAHYSWLLGRDKPGPEIKGLWFGLVEMFPPEDSDQDGESRDSAESDDTVSTFFTPYIAGTDRFDPEDADWPCGPAWMAKDCYAPNESMWILSKLREDHEKYSWMIETALIEPLHTLFTVAYVRGGDLNGVLSGPAGTRGVGPGLDAGDLRTLGSVDAEKGFIPARSAK